MCGMSEKKEADNFSNHHSVIEELLNRESPLGYVEEWSELIKQGKGEFHENSMQPVLVFRSNNEWLGLPVKVIKDIVPIRTVHSIPHRMNDILRGTVNVRGSLKLFVSIANILEITQKEDQGSDPLNSGLMCLISLDHNDWVIKVDEIFGIRRIAISSLENVPVTVSKSTANFLKGIFRIDGKDIGLIEEELLFYSLKRRACD